ncbi:MAG: hypothetical protein HQK72_12130 [Desulfamplus sp.]|nr:hypothetical protein [Desulfamplus sp.]
MYFLTTPLVDLALQHFDHLPLAQGDNFFSTFGPGNLINATNKPHERFNDYEELLQRLRQRNQQKYEQVHKGTPFFFLSWLAFDLRNYEKALYYLDAAISEDVKNAGGNWINLPGAQFLTLTQQQHVAGRIISTIRDLLEHEINRFNQISGLAPITIAGFIDKFVSTLIQDPQTRTIVSAFYIFLLEKTERVIELNLRSTEGSSLGPIISHLFGGGLIFESLLKNRYPTKDDGTPVNVLGNVFFTTSFRNDFSQGIQTHAESLQDILDAINDDSFITAFTATARLRNTTGHNLVWDNIFNTSANYETLYQQIVNALFYVIERKFIR